jgi:hypothetical protein
MLESTRRNLEHVLVLLQLRGKHDLTGHNSTSMFVLLYQYTNLVELLRTVSKKKYNNVWYSYGKKAARLKEIHNKLIWYRFCVLVKGNHREKRGSKNSKIPSSVSPSFAWWPTPGPCFTDRSDGFCGLVMTYGLLAATTRPYEASGIRL